MRRKQREAFGLIPEFAAETGPRRVKEQFDAKSARQIRQRFNNSLLYTVCEHGARSLHPVLPTTLLAGLRALLGNPRLERELPEILTS